VINDLVKAERSSRESWLLIAASVALALVTLVPSGGASLAVGAGMASVAMGAYSALKDPSTRYAYDEFRSRVAEGRLYVAAPAPAPRPAPGRVEHLAPPRTPRTRPPMPPWLRATLAALMMVLGVFGLGWALFGELPSPAHADTPVAVQVTLVIMALKFLACGVAVGWYPRLRARWHH